MESSSYLHPQPVMNGADPPPLIRKDSSNGKRLIESIYGVEARADQPRKKAKPTKANESEEPSGKKQNFNSSGTGIVSDYMNPAKDPDAEDKPTLIPSALVDLTNDDDDDDEIQITGSTNVAEKEVFFGAIYVNVDAYLTPKPSGKLFNHTSGMWPAIKCVLERRPEDSKTLIITVLDSHQTAFAKVEQSFAKVLAPAMDGFPKLRTTTLLLSRKSMHEEWPHQPTSMLLQAQVLIYGRRCDADKLGRLFGQGNVWLMDSSMKEPGRETVNPHRLFGAKKNAQNTQQIRSSVKASNVIGGDASEEEATQNVMRIFDHHATETLPDSEAPPTILTPLLPHQKQALTFMLRHESPRTYGDEASGNSTLWQKKFKKSGKVYYEEAVSNLTLENQQPPESFGGLLADVMGLGKTLESLTLIAATAEDAEQFGKTQPMRSKDASPIDANTKGTLIVCPMSTVANWESQIKEHLDKKSFTWYTHHGSSRIKNVHELRKFNIVITTYGTLQSESRRGDGVLKMLKWFRIILDEAHTIREPSAQQSQACYALEAERRWCLTGTPIQNKLGDLGSLCQFLRIFPYDTVQNFQYYIGKRASQGDSSFLVKLRVMIDSFTLRRQRDQINLPEKQDLTEAIEFSESEKKLHDFFRDRAQIAVDAITKREGKKQNLQISVLQGITTLRLIAAHGRELLRDEHLEDYKGANANEPIDLDEDQGPKTITRLEAYEIFKMMVDADFDICRNCDTAITGNSPLADFDDDALARCYVLPCRDLICADCFRQYQPIYDMQEDNHPVVCPLCTAVTSATYIPIQGSVNDTIEKLQASRESTPTVDKYTGPHTKTLSLLRDIDEMTKESKTTVEARGESPLKCVVFSEFTSHLTLIARALHARGYRTERIDGSMSLPKRKKVLEALATDDSLTILLASIKAAGQGLNLTSASRAFIMEPLWNPAAEAQAVDRIYRIGQTRPVLVKRYHMKDSIEEIIMKLAEKKQKLADLSMNRNHKSLSKKEQREQHYEDIKALFAAKRR